VRVDAEGVEGESERGEEEEEEEGVQAAPRD